MRLILHGVHGPLRLRDLEIGGAGHPKGASPDHPAGWIVPRSNECRLARE
jgi:hypothetical protein